MFISVESLTQMQNIIFFARSSRTNRGGTASSQKMVKFLTVGNKVYFSKKNWQEGAYKSLGNVLYFKFGIFEVINEKIAK